MVAEVLAGLTVETVGWDHVDAVRLRADQQQEIDLRYAQPGRPSTTDADGAPVPDARDQVDPSNVFATLLLRVDGEPAGHAALRDLSGRDDYQGGLHPDGTAEVKRVYVAPGFRGRGLSRTLMTVAEDAARAAGVRHLILESGLMQPESLGLYLRLGYDPVESFGVFSDEPGSRCFGKWLVPDAAPVVEPVETPTSASRSGYDAARSASRPGTVRSLSSTLVSAGRYDVVRLIGSPAAGSHRRPGAASRRTRTHPRRSRRCPRAWSGCGPRGRARQAGGAARPIASA